MRFSVKSSIRWSIFISVFTFIVACILTVASTAIMAGVNWGIGMLIVIIVILIGIVFDVLGLAAAAASEMPFHGMASEKVKGSRHAIHLTRHADRVSNFCNDVIGDICSVISGAAVTAVVIKLFASFEDGNEWERAIVTVLFTALVSALTVGGKAMGKSFAIYYSTPIILVLGKIVYFLEIRCKIRLFVPKRKQRSSNGKRGKKHAPTNHSA